jgi:ABC-type Fe3+/spermidine/putrescine transport system ATPase subunit
VTTVIVTHDREEALDIADSIAVLNKGRIEQVGNPTDLYDNPTKRVRVLLPGLGFHGRRQGRASP